VAAQRPGPAGPGHHANRHRNLAYRRCHRGPCPDPRPTGPPGRHGEAVYAPQRHSTRPCPSSPPLTPPARTSRPSALPPGQHPSPPLPQSWRKARLPRRTLRAQRRRRPSDQAPAGFDAARPRRAEGKAPRRYPRAPKGAAPVPTPAECHGDPAQRGLGAAPTRRGGNARDRVAKARPRPVADPGPAEAPRPAPPPLRLRRSAADVQAPRKSDAPTSPAPRRARRCDHGNASRKTLSTRQERAPPARPGIRRRPAPPVPPPPPRSSLPARVAAPSAYPALSIPGCQALCPILPRETLQQG